MMFKLVSKWPLILAIAIPSVGLLGLIAVVLSATTTRANPVPVVAAGADPPGGQGAPALLPPPAGLLVYVSGAVVNPGLYRVNRGDRVYDAVAAAGGLTAEADPGRMPDMAGSLKDGQQVKVPVIGSTSSGISRVAKTSLNTAPIEELASIPGFTLELAQAVVDYRHSYGPFSALKELVTELGMSQDAYTQAKTYLKL
jgi:competence protein ComEA